MSILAPNKNPKEFVIALYSRPNESFPAKLDVMVNGHVGILVEGQPCVLPRFLVDQALQSHQFTHREKAAGGNDDTYETLVVKPNIQITVIDEEYQSPDGITKLLADATKIKDVDSPYYRLRLGCKNLIFGDMRPAELAATEAIKNSPKAIDMENIQLKAKLFDSDQALKATEARLSSLEDKLSKLLDLQIAQATPAKKAPKVKQLAQIEDEKIIEEAEKVIEVDV